MKTHAKKKPVIVELTADKDLQQIRNFFSHLRQANSISNGVTIGLKNSWNTCNADIKKSP